jgi:hypothetical protein
MNSDEKIKIFMVYGSHNNKVFNEAIACVEKVISENNLDVSKSISIIENGVSIIIPEGNGLRYMTPDEFDKIPSIEFLKDAIELKNEFEEEQIKNLKNNQMDEKSKPFHQRLMEYFNKKKITFEQEKIAPYIYQEYIKRHIEFKQQYVKQTKKVLNGVPLDMSELNKTDFFDEQNNLRDKNIVNQVTTITKTKKFDSIIIVRGFLHKKLSTFLSDEEYFVKDYSYT